MGRLFGTDGIRGRANQYPITPEVALSLGKAVVKVLAKKRRRPRIVVGKDTRISCYMLELAVSSGITSMGGDVLLTGPIPTPGIAFLTVSMRCDAGVVISASHNPFYDNGIKFFGEKGRRKKSFKKIPVKKAILSLCRKCLSSQEFKIFNKSLCLF